jgi:hypothetical protein
VSFYVSASNSKGEYEQRLFDLVVTDPANPLVVGNAQTLTAGAVGQAYEAQCYARGGTAPFSWKTSSGSLPPGLSLASDGVLSGTPTSPGSFTWTVEVTDSSSKKATKELNLRIDKLSEPIVFTPNPKAVIRSTTPRIGLNVGDGYAHWNDVKLYNQYLNNPGFEPRSPVRRMFWAWAGSAVFGMGVGIGFSADRPKDVKAELQNTNAFLTRRWKVATELFGRSRTRINLASSRRRRQRSLRRTSSWSSRYLGTAPTRRVSKGPCHPGGGSWAPTKASPFRWIR